MYYSVIYLLGNTSAQKCDLPVIALFYVFSGDFAVRMSALRESAR
jgi:hypothetical protein